MHLRISTPWPYDLAVESDGRAIVAAAFVLRRSSTALALRARSAQDDKLLREASAQVRAYFARRLRRFDLPLALSGPPFACDVWRCVAGLSFGEIVSYADVARAVGRPLAHRGVAMAMARTPIDLFIPAHRVIGADGRVKGARPGSMRMRLLAFERKGRALVRGKRP
jgi:methylated-DNA-[protein]-cysteine S-methyltransferase